MPQYHFYEGPLAEIPDTASKGILFFKIYLPMIDSTSPPLETVLSPNVIGVMNGGPEFNMLAVLPPMLAQREQTASFFSHTEKPVRVWDLEDDGGKRTVMSVSISRTVFKGENEDPNGLTCHEMNMLELEPAPEGQGTYGLWVVNVNGYLDVSQFKAREERKAAAGGN